MEVPKENSIKLDGMIKKVKDCRSPLKDYTNVAIGKSGGGGNETSPSKTLPAKASGTLVQNKSETHFTSKGGSGVTLPVKSHTGAHSSELKAAGNEQDSKTSLKEPGEKSFTFDHEEEDRFEDAEENKLSITLLAEDLNKIHLSTPGKANTFTSVDHEFIDNKEYTLGLSSNYTSHNESYNSSEVSFDVYNSFNSSVSSVNNESLSQSIVEKLDIVKNKEVPESPPIAHEVESKENSLSSPMVLASSNAEILNNSHLLQEDVPSIDDEKLDIVSNKEVPESTHEVESTENSVSSSMFLASRTAENLNNSHLAEEVVPHSIDDEKLDIVSNKGVPERTPVAHEVESTGNSSSSPMVLASSTAEILNNSHLSEEDVPHSIDDEKLDIVSNKGVPERTPVAHEVESTGNSSSSPMVLASSTAEILNNSHLSEEDVPHSIDDEKLDIVSNKGVPERTPVTHEVESTENSSSSPMVLASSTAEILKNSHLVQEDVPSSIDDEKLDIISNEDVLESTPVTHEVESTENSVSSSMFLASRTAENLNNSHYAEEDVPHSIDDEKLDIVGNKGVPEGTPVTHEVESTENSSSSPMVLASSTAEILKNSHLVQEDVPSSIDDEKLDIISNEEVLESTPVTHEVESTEHSSSSPMVLSSRTAEMFNHSHLIQEDVPPLIDDENSLATSVNEEISLPPHNFEGPFMQATAINSPEFHSNESKIGVVRSPVGDKLTSDSNCIIESLETLVVCGGDSNSDEIIDTVGEKTIDPVMLQTDVHLSAEDINSTVNISNPVTNIEENIRQEIEGCVKSFETIVDEEFVFLNAEKLDGSKLMMNVDGYEVVSQTINTSLDESTSTDSEFKANDSIESSNVGADSEVGQKDSQKCIQNSTFIEEVAFSLLDTEENIHLEPLEDNAESPEATVNEELLSYKKSGQVNTCVKLDSSLEVIGNDTLPKNNMVPDKQENSIEKGYLVEAYTRTLDEDSEVSNNEGAAEIIANLDSEVENSSPCLVQNDFNSTTGVQSSDNRNEETLNLSSDKKEASENDSSASISFLSKKESLERMESIMHNKSTRTGHLVDAFLSKCENMEPVKSDIPKSSVAATADVQLSKPADLETSCTSHPVEIKMDHSPNKKEINLNSSTNISEIVNSVNDFNPNDVLPQQNVKEGDNVEVGHYDLTTSSVTGLMQSRVAPQSSTVLEDNVKCELVLNVNAEGLDALSQSSAIQTDRLVDELVSKCKIVEPRAYDINEIGLPAIADIILTKPVDLQTNSSSLSVETELNHSFTKEQSNLNLSTGINGCENSSNDFNPNDVLPQHVVKDSYNVDMVHCALTSSSVGELLQSEVAPQSTVLENTEKNELVLNINKDLAGLFQSSETLTDNLMVKLESKCEHLESVATNIHESGLPAVANVQLTKPVDSETSCLSHSVDTEINHCFTTEESNLTLSTSINESVNSNNDCNSNDVLPQHIVKDSYNVEVVHSALTSSSVGEHVQSEVAPQLLTVVENTEKHKLENVNNKVLDSLAQSSSIGPTKESVQILKDTQDNVKQIETSKPSLLETYKSNKINKVSPKRNLMNDFQAAQLPDTCDIKESTFCELFGTDVNNTDKNTLVDFDERLAQEAANISDLILNVSQEFQDSDSDSDNNKTVITVNEDGNECGIVSLATSNCLKKSPSAPVQNLREIHDVHESSQLSCPDSASIESYMQSMRSVLPVHLNQSEAGPITADELSTQDLEFQDGAQLDLDFFTRVGSTETVVRNDLTRDSLYVKFDPIVGSIVSKTVSDTFTMPPPSLPENDKNNSEEQSESIPSEAKTGGQGDAQKTPGRSPALEAVQKLISLTPPSAASSTATPVKTDRGSVGTPSITKSPGISQEQLKKELKKLEELMKEREIYFECELGKKQTEIERKEADVEAAASRRAEVETELKVAVEREHRLKKEVQERTKSKQQLSLVMEEYEKTISQLVAQKEEEKKEFEVQKDLLIKERDTAMQHLNNMEIAFNDVHQKYERSKTVIEGMKANEDILKRSLTEYDEAIKSSGARYDSLKTHAIRQLETANQELDLIRRSHQAEIAKLKAMLKKADVRVTSLEESLEQKSKENLELTAICDELINKVGSGGN